MQDATEAPRSTSPEPLTAAFDRRVVRAWCLYDFGNSAFAVIYPAIFALFYAGTVVGNEQGEGDLWWGRTVAAGMLLVALTAPFLGGVADHAGVRKRMLGAFTGLGILSVLCFGLLGPGDTLAGFFLGATAAFAFEGGIVFYNSYLPRIAPPSWQGRVSAWGFAVGYAGSLLALVVAAIVDPKQNITWVWVALAAQWALGAFLALRRLPPDPPGKMSLVAAARSGVRDTWKTLQDVLGMRDLRNFLLAYFVYMDGVETVVVFAAIYATTTLHFTATEAIGMLGLVQVTALLGALALAKTTDVRGPRFTVRLTLAWWVLVVIAASQAASKEVFWVVAGLAGLGLGAVQSASRTFLSRLVPRGREAEMFGFMALCGRSGSIVGPLVFGAVAAATGDQRQAVLCVLVFYVVGFVLVSRVRDPGVA